MLKMEVSGLHEAAFLLGFFALMSQVLALVRDRLLAHTFGASSSLDVYYAAFRVPDFIYTSIASFVSITVLIPFLSRYFREDDSADARARARVFLGSVFSVFMASIMLVSVVAFILMPYLAPYLAPGFDSEQLSLLTLLSRMMLLSPILLGVSNLFGSVTQLFKKFFVYALAPVLYNGGIIAGVIFFYPSFGLTGLAIGVILGALLHMLIQIPVVRESGLFPKLSLSFDWATIREVVALSLPRTIALSASVFTLMIITALASMVYSGAISVFNFSFNLQSVPLSIIGVSYSLAAFPTLAGFFSRGERALFAEHIVEALRHIIFWSLPITALFIVLRAQIVRVILGSGSFSWADTRLTAAALALFSVSILAQGVVLLLARGFYAAGETKIPLFVNIAASAVTVFLSLELISVFESTPTFRYFMESILRVDDLSGTAILMLPLAYSIGMLGNALLLWFFFESRHVATIPRSLNRTLFESFSAAVFIGFVSYLSLVIFGHVFNLNTFLGIFFQGLFSGVFGIIAGVALLKLLGSRELTDVSAALHKRFWKADVIAPELSEL